MPLWPHVFADSEFLNTVSHNFFIETEVIEVWCATNSYSVQHMLRPVNAVPVSISQLLSQHILQSPLRCHVGNPQEVGSVSLSFWSVLTDRLRTVFIKEL